MKAKVLLTGEIVDVSYIGQRGTGMTNIYMDSFNRTYAEYELEFINETDESVIVHHIYNQVDDEKYWMDARERIASDVMKTLIATVDKKSFNEDMYDDVAETSVKFADALIKKLRNNI